MRSKRNRPETGLGKVKLVLVGILFSLIWAALLARTAYIQLYKGEQYSELASKQTLSTEFERGRRGRILDRDGNLLATSVESKSVYLHPFKLEDKAAAVNLLASTLELPRTKLTTLLDSKKSFVWVKRQIKDREAAALAQAPTPGVYLTNEYVRLYPQGNLAGQLLGFVNIDGNGLEGMENRFNGRMAGGKAEFVVQRDNLGRRLYLDASGREMDIDGADITLTIDSHVQALTERAMEKTIAANKAKSGMAVVVDVASGDILALANMPFFNPNSARTSSAKQRRLRPALDVHEPGSTMKPFLFAAALEQGTIKPGERIDCENGRYKVGPGWVHDHHPYKWLTINEVLRYSSNIGSAKIAQDLGAQNYYWYLTRLGFGKKPLLPLPSLSSGTLHPVEKWRKFDLAAAAFGHGIGVTALQLTQAYMAIAAKGELRPLRLVLDPASDTPETPSRVFSTQTIDIVLEMMREVVELDGTGRSARIPGVTIAGKTGTAQKPKEGGYSDEYLSSFVAMVPGENPELLIVAMVDEPGGDVNAGGKVVAPAVREIAMETLAYYGKLPAPPEDEEPIVTETEVTVDSDTPEEITEKVLPPGELVPNLRGLSLRRALELLGRKGVVPLLKGGGVTVSGQKPEPGQPWPEAGDKGESDV
ncbi:MAG: peptidoglycan synthetase, partial [Proteobacteria bacterium]|nr:peptidoglycan synthetase [Pseudomonadota bacterium]